MTTRCTGAAFQDMETAYLEEIAYILLAISAEMAVVIVLLALVLKKVGRKT